MKRRDWRTRKSAALSRQRPHPAPAPNFAAKVLERAGAFPGRLFDLALGDRIADADVHRMGCYAKYELFSLTSTLGTINVSVKNEHPARQDRPAAARQAAASQAVQRSTLGHAPGSRDRP